VTDYTKAFMALENMMVAHWEEVGMPGGPDEARIAPSKYILLGNEGYLVVVIAKDGEEPVGYMAAVMDYHLHHQHKKFGVVDSTYLKPEYRKGLNASRMIKYMEKVLKDRGVDYIQISVNANKDLQSLMKRCKYSLSDLIYTKLL
jgi:hypothetical protein